jgi:hypothetical protein
MRKLVLILVVSSSSLTLFFSCRSEGVADTTSPKHGLVGLALQLNQNAVPGLDGYLDALNAAHATGINLYGMSPEWTDLETAPFTFSLQKDIVNPLTLLDPNSTKLKSFILVIKMIDTNRKILPGDIASKSFDDPEVIHRFLFLLDAIAVLQQVDRISHILIGNEVDAYLSTNPGELNAFKIFYTQAVNHIHQTMPWIKAGTIITFNSHSSNLTIFNTLTPLSDFVCYTYYPTDEQSPQWKMRPPADAVSDIKMMAERAGSKSFAFTEIGYSSSTENNSSEQLQKQFVETMFASLRPYKETGKLEFVYYHGLYDYAPGFCNGYGQSQGIDPTYLCGFLNNLGLKNYTTGNPKPAWDAFVKQMNTW